MSTTAVTLRAPGKAMVLGEYVVLDGAPAIVTAVTRYASARLESCSSDRSIRITTSLSNVPWQLRDESGATHGAPTDAFALVDAVVQTLRARGRGFPESGLTLHLDSSALSDAQKLGLGSSAAIAALCTLALGGERGFATDDAVHAIADEAHRRFQAGAGSGADIAAACFGGVIQIQRGHAPRRVREALPPMLVVYTGYEANTRDFVARVRAQSGDRDVERALAAMHDATLAGVDALHRGAHDAFLRAVQQFHADECALTEASGVPVVTEEIARAVEIFEASGGVGKASGAGGGDIVLGFFPDTDALARARDRIDQSPLTRVDLAIETRGILETNGR